MTAATRTTYRRKDGQPISVSLWTGSISCGAVSSLNERPRIVQMPALDYIEEQWDGDTLVRYRTIRLGKPEKCDNPECDEGDVWFKWGNDQRGFQTCPVCNGTEIKSRNPNPSWTEV